MAPVDDEDKQDEEDLYEVSYPFQDQLLEAVNFKRQASLCFGERFGSFVRPIKLMDICSTPNAIHQVDVFHNIFKLIAALMVERGIDPDGPKNHSQWPVLGFSDDHMPFTAEICRVFTSFRGTLTLGYRTRFVDGGRTIFEAIGATEEANEDQKGTSCRARRSESTDDDISCRTVT